MDFKDMKGTINGEEWKFGDGLCRPVFSDGVWIVSTETFKFLKTQYEAIKKGEAFKFNEDDMGTGRSIAFIKCRELVEKLNNKNK